MTSPDITLYSAPTPNGWKISIALEELGVPYELKKIDISKDEQKQPSFLEISANGRIPAITDKSFDDGKPLHIFESGAILQYIADKYDTEHKISYPRGTRLHWEQQQWVFFQNAGVGPMQGQAFHFAKFAPEKIPYAIERYTNETMRLYGVLNQRLADVGTGYLVGDHISIADITTFGWVSLGPYLGWDLAQFPKLNEWVKTLEQREAFQKGMKSPPRS